MGCTFCSFFVIIICIFVIMIQTHNGSSHVIPERDSRHTLALRNVQFDKFKSSERGVLIQSLSVQNFEKFGRVRRWAIPAVSQKVPCSFCYLQSIILAKYKNESRFFKGYSGFTLSTWIYQKIWSDHMSPCRNRRWLRHIGTEENCMKYRRYFKRSSKPYMLGFRFS